MAKHLDPRTLYSLCTSTDPVDLHQGFEQLWEILFPVARAQLNSAYFDEAAVQDCVQEALLAIWQKLKEGHGPDKPDSFPAWSIRFAIFRAIDYARRLDRKIETLDALPDETPLSPLPNSSSEETLLPDHLVQLNDEKVRLLLSIHHHPALSEESKRVLIEGFLFEKSDHELAALLATTYKNIQVIRFRNRNKLRGDEQWIAQLRP